MTTTITATDKLNGVDVERLYGTIKDLEEKPELARFEFRAQNRWINGGHNQSSIKGFFGAGEEDKSRNKPFVLDNGEPDVLLGKDEGANPVEYVLHGLAGCMTTSMVYHAAARGIKIKAIESTLSGELDLRGLLGISKDVRNGYKKINVAFKIKADATDEQLEELIQIAKNHSPVYDTISRPVPIEVSVHRK